MFAAANCSYVGRTGPEGIEEGIEQVAVLG